MSEDKVGRIQFSNQPETYTEKFQRLFPKGAQGTDKFDATFHQLWGTCVGTKDYDKAAWLSVQRQLNAIGIHV